MTKIFKSLLLLIAFALIINLSYDLFSYTEQEKLQRQKILDKYKTMKPTTFSLYVKGVRTRLKTKDKVVALTFDGCGGKLGSGYDEKLIDFLIKENIPATLFHSSPWIGANLETFKKLSQNPLFDIGNHGFDHKPCSANGAKAYHKKGTKNISEMYDEMELNALKILSITGKKPKYYRSGTAHYDNVCVAMSKDMGYELINFDIIADDASPKLKPERIARNIANARPGSIILMHMNQPKWNTLNALKIAIPQLREKGYRFVLLKDYELE